MNLAAPDDGDLSRPAQIFVSESDYDRAHQIFYAEREDELWPARFLPETGKNKLSTRLNAPMIRGGRIGDVRWKVLGNDTFDLSNPRNLWFNLRASAPGTGRTFDGTAAVFSDIGAGEATYVASLPKKVGAAAPP